MGEKTNCQFRGSNCQIKRFLKFRFLKGVGTFDRHVQGVVNYFYFFLINWRSKRQTNTTMMIIMVQLLRKAGRRHGVHGVGDSLPAAGRSRKRKKQQRGGCGGLFGTCFPYAPGYPSEEVYYPCQQQTVNCTSSTRLVNSKGKRKKTCQGILVFMIRAG